MYRIRKRMEISAAHQLKLAYDSPCCALHGHNWVIEVTVQGEYLNSAGMLIDFGIIKKHIHDKLDHKNINDVLPEDLNPTAENIAKWCCEVINEKLLSVCPTAEVSEVYVQESENNEAWYQPI